MMLVLYTKRHQTNRERTTDADDGDIAYRLMRIAYKEDCREIRGMGAKRWKQEFILLCG